MLCSINLSLNRNDCLKTMFIMQLCTVYTNWGVKSKTVNDGTACTTKGKLGFLFCCFVFNLMKFFNCVNRFLIAINDSIINK